MTGDGRLIGMTFEQEQNVFAWHEHTTDGTFESVACIYGEDADEVWVTVAREDIDGNTIRRMERLDPVGMSLDWSAPARLMYLDSARRFEFDEADTSLTGLAHLALKTVTVVADGYEVGEMVVASDGTLELETAASVVVVGLPYESNLQPMKQEFQMQNGSAQGRPVKVSEVVLKLYNSMAGTAADAPDGRFEPIPYRAPVNPMDTAVPLYTGDKQVHLEARTRESVDVCVKTSAPFPLNVTGMVIKLDVNDR